MADKGTKKTSKRVKKSDLLSAALASSDAMPPGVTVDVYLTPDNDGYDLWSKSWTVDIHGFSWRVRRQGLTKREALFCIHLARDLAIMQAD